MRARLNVSTICLLFFVILKFFLQYVLINPGFDLHRDEYLHLDQGRHLAWGYESLPPFTSWVSYIIVQFGNEEWLVKFFPALFGALTMLVVWKITDALKGDLFAKILGAVAITFSAILRVNILYQPNSFDILCWTTLYACVIAFVIYREHRWLYFAAIVFALGFLNKYNIAFLVAGLFPALLFTEHRRLFLNKHLYGAIILAFLLVLPNLIWQYQHDFPVIHHMQALNKTQLVNVNRSDFIRDQLLFFLPSVYIVLAGLFSFFSYKPFRTFRFIAFSYFIILFIFILLKAKSYYSIGLYPILIPFGTVYLANLLNRRYWLYLRPVLVIGTLLLTIPLLKIAYPIYAPEKIFQQKEMYRGLGMLKWEDGEDHDLPQDFADMLGWKEMARKVDEAQLRLGDDEHTLILCDNYGQAGAINYYTKMKPKAVSFNADYKNWIELDHEYRNIIRVKEWDADDSTLQENAADFETVFIASRITDTLAREKGTTIYIFKNARVNLNDSLRKYVTQANSFGIDQ